MAGDWQAVTLGDLVSIRHGWPFRSQQFIQERTGRPVVVSIGNFEYTGGFRFESTTVKEYGGEYPTGFELSPGDILLVMTCQTPGGEILGIPARIPDNGHVYLHNQRLGKVVVERPDLVDPDFLYWLFLWRKFNQELVATASGTKILHTAPSRIEAFVFDLPPLAEQRAIAYALRALQEKIDLNRHMNHTLEGLARAIFQSWFVDFDPVVAKADGRAPVGMSPATAALFPDSFQDSTVGPIPQGWKVTMMGDEVELTKGKSYRSSELRESRTALVTLKSFRRGGGYRRHGLKGFVGSCRPEQVLSPGDLIVAQTDVTQAAEVIGRAAIVLPTTLYEMLVASLDVLIVRPRTRRVTVPFLYCLMRADDYQEHIVGYANGTTVLHLDKHGVPSYRFPLPPAPVMEAFHSIAHVLLQRVAANVTSEATLASLRDALLPKLMSGEIRVKAAEKLIGEVA